jgi:hypothetical protein
VSVLVSVVEARGLPVVDCLAVVSISGQSHRYTTRASGRTATPRWRETFTFHVADAASSTLSVQLIQHPDESAVGAVTLPLGDVRGDSFDVWLPLGGSGDLHLVVERRATARGADSDEEEEEAAAADAGDTPAPQSAREGTLERFLRACGLDPAQVRAKARDDAAWRVQANWNAFDLGRSGLKGSCFGSTGSASSGWRGRRKTPRR